MKLFKKVKQLRKDQVAKGSYIFKEGDFGEYAFRILDGRVEISIGETTDKVVLANLGSGEVFGEMGMIGRSARSASALALTQVTLEIMTEEEFNSALLEKTNALIPYLSSIFDRMRNMNDAIREASLNGASYVKDGASLIKDDSQHALSDKNDLKEIRLVADSDRLLKQEVLKNRKVDDFPFFIGRRRDSAAIDIFQKNQLAIFDERPYSISRNHCAIECDDDGFYVRDRGSHTGTIVNGVRINGNGTSIDRVKLDQVENTLILGGADSEARFKIVLAN